MKLYTRPLVELMDEIEDNLNNLSYAPYFMKWYGGIKESMEELRAVVYDQMSDINMQIAELDYYLYTKYLGVNKKVEKSGLSCILRHWNYSLNQAPKDVDFIKEDIQELSKWIEKNGMVKVK
jgi:hypothetical protein